MQQAHLDSDWQNTVVLFDTENYAKRFVISRFPSSIKTSFSKFRITQFRFIMKVLEAQSATLTNYEVYQHLAEQRTKYAKVKGRRPGNLETVVKELLDYFNEAPSPLASKPFPYHDGIFKALLERLRPWDFTKAEILMILNLRPTKPENLNTIVEEMEERFPGDELQWEIVGAIAEILGKPDGEAERQAMTDEAKEARKEQENKQDDGMEMGE